jgi:hypothetical protein
MNTYGSFEELFVANSEVEKTLNFPFPAKAPQPGTKVAIGAYPARIVEGGMAVSFDAIDENGGKAPFEMPLVVPANRLLAAQKLNAKIQELGLKCDQITSSQVPILEDKVNALDALRKNR